LLLYLYLISGIAGVVGFQLVAEGVFPVLILLFILAILTRQYLARNSPETLAFTAPVFPNKPLISFVLVIGLWVEFLQLSLMF